MTDLVLPSTNGGALVQAVLLAVVGSGGLFATRRHAEARTFVLGLVVAAAAWMALRTVH